MNKTRIIKSIIPMAIIIVVTLMVSAQLVLADVQQYYEDIVTDGGMPWDDVQEGFCVEHGDAYGLGETIRYMVTHDTDAIVEPSVGYAKYIVKNQYGVNVQQAASEDMQAVQQVIWAAQQWGTSENVELCKTLGLRYDGKTTAEYLNGSGGSGSMQSVIISRAFQYGSVYYGMLYDKEDVFNVVPGERLDVLVDRVAQDYIVGPYKLVVKDEYTRTFDIGGQHVEPINILYNELMQNGQNYGYNEDLTFARFYGIEGINGTDAKLIDANGNDLKFPDFRPGNEQDFYIRFKPNNDGAIFETGVPILNVQYIVDIKAEKYTYNADVAISEGNVPGSSDPLPNTQHPVSGSNAAGQRREIRFDELKIDGMGILEYAEKYARANMNRLSWYRDDSSSDYYLADIRNVNATYRFTYGDGTDARDIEFPVVITVRARVVDNQSTGRRELQYDSVKYVRIRENDNAQYQIIYENLISGGTTNPTSNTINNNGNTTGTPTSNGTSGSMYVPIQQVLSEQRNIIQNIVNVVTSTVEPVIANPQDRQNQDGNNTIANNTVANNTANNVQHNEHSNSIYYNDTTNNTTNNISGNNTTGNNTVSGNNTAQNTYENEIITPLDEMGRIKLLNVPINMQIGGNVWLENPALKSADINGILDEGDRRFAGIQVRLYEYGDTGATLIATTTTDQNGKYRFYGKKDENVTLLNPLRKYYVLFTYDGQRYQATYYKQQLSGGYSNAKEIKRDEFNQEFKDIYSDPLSFEKKSKTYEEEAENITYSNPTSGKAYALEEKIKNANGDFINYEGRALKYYDIYNAFLSMAVYPEDAGEPSLQDYNKIWNRSKDYYQIIENDLKSWIQGFGISEDENNSIRGYIYDTFMKASTKQDTNVFYAPYDRFILREIDSSKEEYNTGAQTTLQETFTNVYCKASDMSRYVDFGVYARDYNDLALQKDLLKTTVIVNGKIEEYEYAKKFIENETWDIIVRASDSLYNGNEIYRREVRSSDYLLDGSDSYNSADQDKKNLQVYVTYRIAVKNSGTVNATVNEVVDYYDRDQYTFVEAYIGGDANGTRVSNDVDAYESERIAQNELFRKQDEVLTGANYNYSKLYFSGRGGAPLGVKGGDTTLRPGDIMFLYAVFKVNSVDGTEYGRIKLDQDIYNGTYTVGKRNIAEINAYSTYYANGTVIPETLSEDDSPVSNVINNDNTPAGIVDFDSAPGSLRNKDLDDNGNIRTNPNNELENRIQDDIDKSPNLRITIDGSADNVRTVDGYVFEDTRDTQSGDAEIGNGQNNDETRINGVTLQLVELVSKVDDRGVATGEYIGEKVWGSYEYSDLNTYNKTLDRYASGADKSKVIISGPGILKIEPNTFEGGKGAYSFKSLPAGDFYVRFIYGDTDETVLSNRANEVTSKLNRYGLNEKSYNGQDYKSTIYQLDVPQENSYNGIDEYMRVNEQNAYKIDDLYVDHASVSGVRQDDVVYNNPSANDNKNRLYYYDIVKNDSNELISDAKDVYDYRQRCIDWSKGVDIAPGDQALLNYRAEALVSFRQLPTIESDLEDMINLLQENTYMVAQSGIINTEVERTRQYTVYERDSLYYNVHHLNLGLTERPKAGLKLNKEVDRFNFTLSNGKVLFDVTNNQSVNNLYYSAHQPHQVEYANRMISRIILNTELYEQQRIPELLQAYVDDELMQRSTVNVRYKFTVENIGEVDYTTMDFYYKGIPGTEDTKSKTGARRIIDYVSNAVKFDQTLQEQNIWNVVDGVDSLLGGSYDNHFVNRIYENELRTYDTILTTDSLATGIVPGKQIGDAKLVVTTIITSDNASDNLVFNNLAEIIATTNDLGRRCEFSIVGNQEMADQSLGNNASADAYNQVDWVKPTEIDADSAQKIVVMPPTGVEQKNTDIVIISIMTATMFIVMAGVLISNKEYFRISL